MTLAIAVLLFVTAQRLGELIIARRNTRLLMAQGAIEHGRAHYPVMVLLHASWLATLWLLAWDRPVNLLLLAAFMVMQGLRVWVLMVLGTRWTTRVIVLPGEPLVARGPFRWVRHPNYCIVVAEIALLPLAFGLIGVAIVFSLLNAWMLWVRIGCENQALAAGPQAPRGPANRPTRAPSR
ncbi:isoprenylcysteine carboxyl methyltransferase family protein [Novosphingobium lentum]|uniref:isoprenylcysteine carboxyl methyltransferase family protein n=1 Tax=Novosphingobium lentum TaxID=145287 RepID=UPI00082C545E|nr:isoprenylcysteine carboxylmethyltransferase family protein [Novosphingobium lentum]